MGICHGGILQHQAFVRGPRDLGRLFFDLDDDANPDSVTRSEPLQQRRVDAGLSQLTASRASPDDILVSTYNVALPYDKGTMTNRRFLLETAKVAHDGRYEKA